MATTLRNQRGLVHPHLIVLLLVISLALYSFLASDFPDFNKIFSDLFFPKQATAQIGKD